MTKMMKALVKEGPKVGLVLSEVPIPECGPNDVLIRVHKTSICGTDIHIWNWDSWAQATIPAPMVTGHEFVGHVVQFGSMVKSCEIGDLVSGEGHIVCGYCKNCRSCRFHLCPNAKGVGVNRTGAFAEYVCIPVENVWHCNPSIPEDILSCFDPLGNATHTALSFCLIGCDVLITGAGPIGLMGAAITRKAGARYVVITDTNEYRLDLARKLGVTRAININSTTLEEVQSSLGMTEGFDVGLEMSGNPLALNDMISNMSHGGKIAQLGLLPEDTTVNMSKIIFNGLTIKGIYGREIFETWYKMSAMIEAGLDISPLITHRFHYTEFEKGFEAMRSGQSGKVVLTWYDPATDTSSITP